MLAMPGEAMDQEPRRQPGYAQDHHLQATRLRRPGDQDQGTGQYMRLLRVCLKIEDGIRMPGIPD